MNSNIIYIAQSDNDYDPEFIEYDISDFQDPSYKGATSGTYDKNSELPPVATVAKKPKTEFQVISQKLLTSFGTMAICILIIAACAYIYKKKFSPEAVANQRQNQRKKQQNQNVSKSKSQPKTANTTSQPRQPMQPPTIEDDIPVVPTIRPRNKKKALNTPVSIHKCIAAFLETTKEN
jgi:cytoskeletal protein RodZ